jgi:hypothetical protein
LRKREGGRGENWKKKEKKRRGKKKPPFICFLEKKSWGYMFLWDKKTTLAGSMKEEKINDK